MSSTVDKYFELLEAGGYVTNTTARIDPIVQSVKNKFDMRSQKGIRTYGVTLEENQDGLEAFLNHLQEELMDGVLYIEKLKRLNK